MSSSIAASPSVVDPTISPSESKNDIAASGQEEVVDITMLNSQAQTADMSETQKTNVSSKNGNEKGAESNAKIVEPICEKQEESLPNFIESENSPTDTTNSVVPQSTSVFIENKQLLSRHVPNARSISSRSNPFDEVVSLPVHESKGLPKVEESIFGVASSMTSQSSVNSETASSRGQHERTASSNSHPVSNQGEEFFAEIFRDSNEPDQIPTNLTAHSVSSSTSDHESNVIAEQPHIIVPPSPEQSDASHINATMCGLNIKMASSDVSNISQSASQSDSLNASNHVRSISMDSQGLQSIQQQQQPNDDESNTQALMLGLEQLERQQAEHEARQKCQMNTSKNAHSYLPSTIHVSSDSQQEYYQRNTMNAATTYHQQQTSQWDQESSYNNTARTPPLPYISDRLNPQQMQLQHAPQDPNYVPKIPQLGKDSNRATRSFRKAFTPLFQYYTNSSKQKNADSFPDTPKTPISEESDSERRIGNKSQAIIYGYLYKLNKSGKWQKRFFETDGQFLTYYKTSKRFKLLATLDLIKVGEISVHSHDTTGCTFQIQVSGRPYFLKAENNGICQDWVINLNRVREARFQMGGMKLIAPHQSFQPFSECEARDGLDRKRSESSSDMVARVTVESNRMRTKRVTGITEYWSNLDKAHNNEAAITPIGVPNHVLLGWQKRRRNFQIIRSKLASFVRWMKLMKHFARKNDMSVHEDHGNMPFETNTYDNSSGAQYRHEEVTVEESELSSRKTAQSIQDSASVSVSNSFDPSRPRLRLQKSISGGSSSMSNPSMRETDVSADPSPKFSAHENLSFEKADYNEEEIEDRGVLS